MKELEVRFSLADKEDYLKVVEFLDQNYQLESENRQIDKYYKERGKETEAEFAFIRSKIETKGYVQLMREKMSV